MLSFDLRTFVIAAGYLGLFGVIFAESGILLGIFFPGDSLLFTAGLLAAQGFFSVVWLMVLCFAAAVLGDNVGYSFGRRVGVRFFKQRNSFFFNQTRVEQAKVFYAAHGGKAIILARFIPGVRTLAPILAGIGQMSYPTFLFYNLVGGLVWSAGAVGLGYWLGSLLPRADNYLAALVLLIIVVSFLPMLWQLLAKPAGRQKVINWIKGKR